MITENKPRFSVLISVYNSGSTLKHCLDNLVYQTFDNIEIIVVDKESTDDSKMIEKDYAERFPDKVRVFDRPYSDNPSAGRNFGLTVARADYITFCDADDYFDIQAFEGLDEFIRNNNEMYDLICFNTVFTKNGRASGIDRYNPTHGKERLLNGDHCMAIWNKIFKRSLVDRCGSFPDNFLEDIAFSAIAVSRADNIGFYSKALYYFELIGGNSHLAYSTRLLDIIKTIDYTLKELPPEHQEAFAVCAAERVVSNIRGNWPYKDIYIEWLYNNRELLTDNRYLRKKREKYNAVQKFISCAERLIPRIVYINGFGGVDESISSEEWIYGDNVQVEILDENTCDIEQNALVSEAVRSGNYDFAAQYFAVRRILETGGFYIGKKVRYNHPINSLRVYNAVFSPFDANEYSSDFFGAAAGSEVISKIADTYSRKFYDDDFLPFGRRAKNILLVVYGMDYSGRRREKNGICITGISETLYDIDNNTNIFTHVHPKADEENCVVINNEILSLLSLSGVVVKASNDSAAQKELKAIKSSDSYKFAMKLKRFGNTKLGKIPKKIFKWFLKKYRKHKYGI